MINDFGKTNFKRISSVPSKKSKIKLILVLHYSRVVHSIVFVIKLFEDLLFLEKVKCAYLCETAGHAINN